MITTQDLSQIKTIVENVVEQKFEEKLVPINSKLDSMDIEFKGINKKLNKLQKGQDEIITYFDNKAIRLEKRVDRIEDHLHLSSLRGV